MRSNHGRFVVAIPAVPGSDAEIRTYLDSLGVPGIIDLHVHFMPRNVMEKVWAFFDGVADSGAPAWRIVYRNTEEERVRTLRNMGVKAFSTLNYAHRPGMAEWLNDYSTAFASVHCDAIHSATFYPEPGVERIVAHSLEQGARIFKVHIQVGGFSPLVPGELTEVRSSEPPSSGEEQYAYYRVQKLSRGSRKDKTRIVYSQNITLEGIPEEVFETR